MCSLVETYRARHWSRLAVLGLVAAGVAGCSADIARFSENPFANPYASRTAAAHDQGAPPVQSAPVGRVETQPLPPPQAAALPPLSGTGVAGPASYGQPVASEVTGSVTAPRSTAAGNNRNWNGGTAVTVEPGDTIESMARRYGVPTSAILQANNLTSPARVQPGQQIVIPRYNQGPATAAGAPSTRLAGHAPGAGGRPAIQASRVGGTHVVQPGETLSSLGRRYGKTRAEIARANNLALDAQIRIGQQVIIPGVQPMRTANAAPAKAVPAAPAPVSVAAKPITAKAPATSGAAQKVAASEPAASARMASAEPAADPEPAPETTGGAPSFRWPARGRVIAAFGPKPNGQQNDGINLAVPEGTSIKAADDGVVAYAGNELKGYGNLVLVRHSSGYVTAYAHASELMVKRGDPVKRGQMIGRAGQTGNVSSPQLHFEIRKGKDPVDPMQYLSGG